MAELRLRSLARDDGEAHSTLKTLMLLPFDFALLRKFAEANSKPALDRLGGVSNANVVGGRDPELQVVVDPEKLAARGLTIQNVRQALRASNKDTSGGDLWEGKRRYVVRTLGQFRSPEQVERQLLTVHDGQ